MNYISAETLARAKEEAIFNIYLYLSGKTTPEENETLQSVVLGLETTAKQAPSDWSARDMQKLKILKNAVLDSTALANSKIGNLTRFKRGLTACTFTKPDGSVSVIFCGTGSGEWLDNGEGLSGIPEENTYITYEKGGDIAFSEIRQKDFATDQQVEALNWFRLLAAKNHWDNKTKITVSGHSKGGNKAQFVAIHSGLVDTCYSFSGQGFSPEALDVFKKMYGEEYEKRRKNIRSFSADNDYVNVLGEQLVPENNAYYFKSWSGFHFPEAILDESGDFRVQTKQGKLSLCIEEVSKELMRMKPAVRQYATRGVMNIFQQYLGDGVSINGNSVSLEETIAGIGIAVGALLRQLYKNKGL